MSRKKRNPRYLITTGEGDELGIFPAFNGVEAVKRARQLYPGRKKLTAKKVDERMYLGNDRAKQIEDRERMARKLERAASRKRNPLAEADAAHLYHEMNEAGQGFAIGEDFDDIGTAAAASGWHVVHRYTISLLLAEDPAGRRFLVGGDGQGRGPWAVSIDRENPRRAVSRTVTRRAVARGVVQPRRRNRTYIHADNIDHLDVAKVHNPSKQIYKQISSSEAEDIFAIARHEGTLFPIGLKNDSLEMALWRERDKYRPLKTFSDELAIAWNKDNQQAYVIRGDFTIKHGTWAAPIDPATIRGENWMPSRRARRNPYNEHGEWVMDLDHVPGENAELDALYADPELRALEYEMEHDARHQLLKDLVLSGEATPFEISEYHNDERPRRLIARALEIGEERRENPRRRRNALDRDSDHPIEVTRHYRTGPPGYLSPWQRAASMGQNELFSTGIALSSRAAERLKSRNPGVTKAAYKAGLKEATAAQLGKLARIGIRTGHTVAEVKADLKATGRFTADQIARGVEQAREAEKRQNPKRRANAEFSKAMIAQLKRHYGKIQTIDPSSSTYAQLQKTLESYLKRPDGKALLEQIANSKIKWVSYEAAKILGYDPSMANRISRGLKKAGDSSGVSQNPSRKTRELYEKFNGRPARKTTVKSAPNGTPKNVAKLGGLRLIKTTDGRKWKFSGSGAPDLAADSRGRLHVVGGSYRANPAGEHVGEIEQIEYETKKPHLGQPQQTIYYHRLGEEGGERPRLVIDREGLIKIHGGDYRIEADGIHD